jgi:hypothetical protein
MLHVVGECHDADIIVVVVRGEREPESGPDDVLHPGFPSNFRREQAASVQHEQYLLAPFFFVLPDDHFASSSCRFPIDVPSVIARHPLSQALEVPTFAETT